MEREKIKSGNAVFHVISNLARVVNTIYHSKGFLYRLGTTGENDASQTLNEVDDIRQHDDDELCMAQNKYLLDGDYVFNSK